MQGASRAHGVRVHEAAGDRVLGGGEVPGRAWRRALCLNSSGPGLHSAVETVPTTTTVPETMAPETMAPQNTEALTPDNTCKPCLQDCAESGGKCQRGSGQGARRARRYAQRRASVPASPSAQQRIGRRINACARRACVSLISSGAGGGGCSAGGQG